jgi:hypothetical protein
VDSIQLRRDRAGVAEYLAGDGIKEEIVALLGRWTEPGRPAVLVALDWDPPYAEVYPEPDLIEAFPDVPVVSAEEMGEIGPGTLLVLVIDERGETAYAIPDPRASD